MDLLEKLNNKPAFQNAVDIFGVDHQIDKCIEECAELIQALEKLKDEGKNEKTLNAVYTEIADVKIMVAQMYYIFGSDNITAEVLYKTERLEKTLKDHCIKKMFEQVQGKCAYCKHKKDVNKSENKVVIISCDKGTEKLLTGVCEAWEWDCGRQWTEDKE